MADPVVNEEKSPWELESGLPNDVDGWMTNSHFGKKEEYAAAVAVSDDETAGTQFIFDLVDAEGNVIGNAGYSIGKGWIVSEDGLEITHPRHRNVIRNTRYGALQERVVEKLGVDMNQYGVPTKAPTWDGLGFHWMLEDAPVPPQFAKAGRPVPRVLMPTIFLNKKEIEATGEAAEPASTKATTAIPKALEDALAALAQKNTLKNFQLAAMKNKEALANEKLMASILNDAKDGFWSMHQVAKK